MATTAAALARPSHRMPGPGRLDREQDLYKPIKRFLENLGCEVKGIDRLAVADLVYLAAPALPTHPGVRRRVGRGLLAVRPAQRDVAERVEVVCDPCPRQDNAAQGSLTGSWRSR